jgi:hypothetical protein
VRVGWAAESSTPVARPLTSFYTIPNITSDSDALGAMIVPLFDGFRVRGQPL